eukprot:1307636-Pleurochrysis_carterae.AAC.1
MHAPVDARGNRPGVHTPTGSPLLVQITSWTHTLQTACIAENAQPLQPKTTQGQATRSMFSNVLKTLSRDPQVILKMCSHNSLLKAPFA